MFMACFGGPGGVCCRFDSSVFGRTGLEPSDLDLLLRWCFLSSLRAPKRGAGGARPAFSRAPLSARADSSSSSPFDSGARLPLRAAARWFLPRAGPRERDPERVSDTRQADVDSHAGAAMGAPEVLVEQPAARAVAFISKTRSVCAGKAVREARQRPDRGAATPAAGSLGGDSSATAWRVRWEKIFSNRRCRLSGAARGTRARVDITRRIAYLRSMASKQSRAAVSRRGAATRARRGPASPLPGCRIRLRLKKSGSFFGLGTEIPPSSANHSATVGEVSTLPRDIFFSLVFGKSRFANESEDLGICLSTVRDRCRARAFAVHRCFPPDQSMARQRS